MIIGNRIPLEYFVTSGKGESDITVHAGSFDMAVKEAGIYNYNIIKYSSIMPKEAIRIDVPKKYVHGSVLESIMAVADGRRGDTVTAGIVIGWIYNKKNGDKIGGLVAEYNGNKSEADARLELESVMKEMFKYRYNSEIYELSEIEIIIKSFVPKKMHGTALVAICFTSYEYPILNKEETNSSNDFK